MEVVKRSKGVTVFAVLVIILSFLSLLQISNPKAAFDQFAKPLGIIMLVMSGLIALFELVSAVNILRLKDWARQSLIWLAFISIAFVLAVPFLVKKEHYSVIEQQMRQGKSFQEAKIRWEEKIANYPLEKQEQIRKNLDNLPRIFLKLIIIFTNSIVVFWNILVIIFFTRPKVRAQFS